MNQTAVSFSTYSEILEALHQQGTTYNVGDALPLGVIDLIIDADSVAESIEDGNVTLFEMVWAIRQARALTDRQLRDYDIFDLDEGVKSLKDNVVRGNNDYVCYTSGIPIPSGQRHRVLVDKFDGELATTRHCELVCWMAEFGRAPSRVYHEGQYVPDGKVLMMHADALKQIAFEDERAAA